MTKLKLAVILYFVDGYAPTPEDLIKAQELGGDIKFRNARMVDVDSDEGLEECDGVAGAVPSNYAEKYPRAEEVQEARKAEFAKMSEKVGDKPVPKAGEATEGAKGDAPAGAGWKAN